MFNAAILCSAMEVIPVLGQKQLCKWSLQFCAVSTQGSFKIQQRGNLMDENTLKSLKTQITSRRKQVLLHRGCHQRFKAAKLVQGNFFSYVNLIFPVWYLIAALVVGLIEHLIELIPLANQTLEQCRQSCKHHPGIPWHLQSYSLLSLGGFGIMTFGSVCTKWHVFCMFSVWVSLFILFSIKELHVSLLHTWNLII